jgi:hypothetical protein
MSNGRNMVQSKSKYAKLRLESVGRPGNGRQLRSDPKAQEDASANLLES